MKPREIFLAALRRGDVPRPAIGSATSIVTSDLLMEVGAAFPAAHVDAREMARVAAAGHTLLGYDNVMPLFGVWHESAALGCAVDWGDNGRMPDGRAVCTTVDESFRIPPDFLSHPGCTVPLKALHLLKNDLGGEIAVVGKVFGPWTLGYHVFGVQEFLMASLLEPDTVKRVMRTLIEVTVAFARAQIDQGADAITLADHCTRDLCSPDTYRDFLLDIHAELNERIPSPLILHICGDTADRLPYIRTTGLPCFHFDSKVPASEARRLAGEELALMGGTSNIDIVRNGTPGQIRADILDKLRAGVDIIGPECAVPLDAPWRNLKLIADNALELHGEGGRGASSKQEHA